MTAASIAWTAERVARLLQAWQVDRLSARVIGLEFGVTKNTVLGKLNRLGALGTKPKTETGMPPSVAAIHDLRAQQCRYPIGHLSEPSFRFCPEDAQSDDPYCAKHHRLCYIPGSRSNAISATWSEERKAKAKALMQKRGSVPA